MALTSRQGRVRKGRAVLLLLLLLLHGSKWWAGKVRHEMTFKRNQCLTDMILTFQILIVLDFNGSERYKFVVENEFHLSPNVQQNPMQIDASNNTLC
ncbi:hypothetical protein RJT34_32526 [Clitoria ternatea]|uniref:Uncharacterized protein n=1 Tax=Clitoria ternatea TaxID=43366 RepID=A0AAN9EYN5_CLITE